MLDNYGITNIFQRDDIKEKSKKNHVRKLWCIL